MRSQTIASGADLPDNFDQLEALDEKGVVAFKSFLG